MVDPVDVLEKIIGGPLKRGEADGDDQEEVVIEKPSELQEDIDFGGISLQEFARSQANNVSALDIEATQESVQSVEECEYVHFYAIIA